MSTPSSPTFRLFDLPRELRDKIYELVLVPRFPIEFAPSALRPEPEGHEGFWEDPHDSGEKHWKHHYYADVQPRLKLLLANRQINDEATPIYYGQEFRFTSQAGWVTLYCWLKLIGERNGRLVKNITVCHPAWGTTPRLCYDLNMKLPFTRMSAPRALVSLLSKDTYTPPLPGAMEILSSMPNPQNVRLVTHARWEDLSVDHPILSIGVDGGPKVTVINLVAYNLTLRLATGHLSIRDPVTAADEIINRNRDGVFDDCVALGPEDLPVILRNLKRNLELLEARGIDITEELYDQHRHWPVQVDEDCVNKDLCDYMRNHCGIVGIYPDEGEFWAPLSACRGTRELFLCRDYHML